MNVNHGFDQISSCPNCQVRAVELFDLNLSTEAAAEVRSMAKVRTHRAGEELFHEGDGPRGVFLIDTGRVKLIKRSADRPHVVKISRHGDVLGLGTTLTNRPHAVAAEALVDSTLRFLAAEQFLDFLKRHPMYLGQVVTFLEQHAHQETPPVVLGSAAEKVAAYLVDAAHRDGHATAEGTSVDLPITFRELSAVLRIRPERLEDVFDRFEDRHWLYRGSRSVTLLDEAGLVALTRH